jgi:hypothetical protein
VLRVLVDEGDVVEIRQNPAGDVESSQWSSIWTSWVDDAEPVAVDRYASLGECLRATFSSSEEIVTLETAHSMEELEAILAAGFSAENVAFGMGGGLLQQVNRDSQRFAYKVSWVERSGRIQPVHKCPVTDPAKTSKAGVLDLIRDERGYRTVLLERPEPHPASCLQTVFENGALPRRCSLEEVRARAMQG